MYILGKTLNGVHYYLATNGEDRPFTRQGKRSFWTRKRTKAYQFETMDAVMRLGYDLMRRVSGVDLYTGLDDMRHLYYGMTFRRWDIFKWLTGLSEAGAVSVTLFYSNLDNNPEYTLSTFTGGYLSNTGHPPLIKSPARQAYKELKAKQKQMMAEAIAEAKANGALPPKGN